VDTDAISQQKTFGFLNDMKADLAAPSLVDRFVVPPFTILDTRQGYWLERRRAWLALGIQSELGRGEKAVTYQIGDKATWDKQIAERASRRASDKQSNITGAPPKPDWATGTGTENMALGTSIFDPMLCEIAYKWFCPVGGRILDPFAGGSVRGIVAESLGYKYTGVELRQEQVDANMEQATAIGCSPRYITGDSYYIDKLVDGWYDFVFSCPPYYNLEVYSELPGELSNMRSYSSFASRYAEIIDKTVAKLQPNRFACFVVSNIRDDKGFVHNLVADTIEAFREAGAKLYNDAILINSIGSLAVRINKQFTAQRKLGKMHQNVLIFYKGNLAEMPRLRGVG